MATEEGLAAQLAEERFWSFVDVMNRAAANMAFRGYGYLAGSHLLWVLRFVASGVEAGMSGRRAFRPLPFARWVELSVDIRPGSADGQRELALRVYPLSAKGVLRLTGLRVYRLRFTGPVPDDAFHLLGRLYRIYTLIGLPRRVFILGVRVMLAGSARTLRASVVATPPLVATIVITFVTGDAWRILGSTYDARYWVLVAVFVVTGLVFVEVSTESRDDLDRVLESVAAPGVPVEQDARWNLVARERRWRYGRSAVRALEERGARRDGVPTRQDRGRMLLQLKVDAARQVLAAGVATALSLVVVGVVRLDAAGTKALTGKTPTVMWAVFGGVVVTRELVLVATSLGALACLWFAAVSLVDDRARLAFTQANGRALTRTVVTIRVYRDARARDRILSGLEPVPAAP